MTTPRAAALATATACVLSFLVAVEAARIVGRGGTRLELGRVQTSVVHRETHERLAALRDDVFITYYVSERALMPSNMRRVERGVTDVLEALKRASRGRLDYQVVDPDASEAARRFASRRGVAPFRSRMVERDQWSERTVWSTLTIAYGPRAESSIHGIGPEHVPRLQRILVEYLQQMEEPRRPVVAVSREENFSELAAALASRAEVLPVDLVGGARLPDRADLLFWLDPGAAGSDELQAVEEFLHRGRSVVIAGSELAVELLQEGGGVAASFLRSENTMEPVLSHFGLRPIPGLVLDGTLQSNNRVEAPFFVRSIPYHHDFRSLRGQPNGALLFLAPTPIALDGPRLEERGFTAEVLVATSDRTSVADVPSAPTPLRLLAAGRGEPAPKLPLIVFLRPSDPWKGFLVACGATTPFEDGFLDMAGAAHGRLVDTLLDNLLAPERLVIHRAGILRPEPLAPLSRSERLFWRTVCVLLAPALLAILAIRTRVLGREPQSPATFHHGSRWLLARAAGGVAVAVAAAHVAALPGGRTDLSRDGVNTLAPETRALAARMRGDRMLKAEVVFSGRERLPPPMRPGLDRLLATLRELRRGGAELSLSHTRPEELDPEELERLAGLSIEPVKVTTREEEQTIVRTLWSALVLESGGRREVVRFPGPASFASLEFRLAFALHRLAGGRRPRVAFVSDTPRLSAAEAHEQYQTQGLLAPRGTDVYSLAREFLHESGFAVSHVNMREPVLPEAYDLLVWLQPRRPVERMLTEAIRHLHEGGAVLLAAQHFNIQSRQYPGTGFELVYWPQPQVPDVDRYYFPRIGIHLVREVLFDELHTRTTTETQVNRGPRPEIDRQTSALPFLVRASATSFADGSRITAGLGDQAFLWGSYLRWDEERLAELGIRATPLMTTSERSWSYAWSGGFLPDELLEEPPRGEHGEPLWLGKQPLAVLFEGRFPLEVVERPVGGLFSPARDDGSEAAARVSPAAAPGSEASGGEGQLLFIGSSEMFKNHRLRDAEFRADHLLLNGVAALALDDDLAAIASRRPVARGFGPLDPSEHLAWRVFVLSAFPFLSLALGLGRSLSRRGTRLTGIR